MNRKIPFTYDVYVVSDSVDILRQAVDDGASIIQLRDKSEDLARIEHKAREISAYKQNHEFLFIVNDYPELAREVGADGVHVGQNDSPIEEVRSVVGNEFLIGKSTHSLEQGLAAQKEAIDYISVGPVFATPTKPGRQAVGLDYIREAAAHITIPFVTIGGINLSTVDQVLAAGARTIGIVRAAAETPQILQKIRDYYSQ